MAIRFVWMALVLLSCSVMTSAQVKPNQPSPDVQRRSPDDKFGRTPDSALPDEMRTRMAMERAENDHRKILEDVDKLNHLSSEVASGYHERGKISEDEIKKLNTIQKLAKHVLSHALGDEVEDKSAKPMTLAEAVDQMKAAAANIKKTMTAETRFEVSAVVIANSNEVISLAQFIKRTYGKSY